MVNMFSATAVRWTFAAVKEYAKHGASLRHEFYSQAGLQAQNYSGTTSLVGWRSLLVVFAQARGSVFTTDAVEAFTQSDKTDRSERKDTILRLPSQWKQKVMLYYLK